MAIASLSLIGYLYGATVLYTVPTVTVIAMQTATFVLAVSFGIVLGVSDHAPMRLLRCIQAEGRTQARDMAFGHHDVLRLCRRNSDAPIRDERGSHDRERKNARDDCLPHAVLQFLECVMHAGYRAIPTTM